MRFATCGRDAVRVRQSAVTILRETSLPSNVSFSMLFLVVRNRREKETHPLGEPLESIAALLPRQWTVKTRARNRDRAAIDLVTPDRKRVSFTALERSGPVSTRYLLSELREMAQRSPAPVMFLSDYIGPSLRAALTEEGIGFADSTGWVRMESTEPLVLITGQGAAQSPRPPRPNSVVRLNGLAANRTIRTLATTETPVGVRELAGIAGVSPGSVSKLLVTLTAESIVDRDDRGGIVAVRKRALIRRWTRDYGFATTNRRLGYYIAPRGLERTLAQLSRSERTAVLTGSAAARRMLPEGTTPIVPLRLLALYSTEPISLVRELNLIDADPSTANVMVAMPQDPQIVASIDEGIGLAPTALVLADLLTLPNRTDAEADQLFDLLVRDDAAWTE